MSSFTIYPAIDLRAGRVVRLKQGDPDRQTIYQNAPVEAARNWIDQGARWLHVVNLSGAFSEVENENKEALDAILDETKQNAPAVKIQFGGGIRSLGDIDRLLSRGVSRVILGTLAASAPDLLINAMGRFGQDAIVVAIDARDGKVRVHGWQQETDLDPLSFGKQLREFGLQTVIFTNISRDGVGTGVDVSSARQLSKESALTVIASGGVNTLEDIHEVRSAGLGGVVIGRALYEGKFTLQEALEC